MSIALALALAATLVQAEGPIPADRVTLDGKALASPAAVISPLGWLRLSGRPETGPGFVFTLHFPRLEWPAPGEHGLAATEVHAVLGTDAEPGSTPVPGKLTVRAFTPSQVTLSFEWKVVKEGEETHRLEASVAPRMHVPVLQERKAPESKPPADRPDSGDLVFCALGNTGTGLSGQRLVAESMAKLAATGPLDFVLLLGNNFLPKGLAELTDPRFARDFVEVYDKRRLDVPFYAVLGPADHRGSASAQASRGAIDTRWAIPDAVFSFELECRGKRVGFVGADVGSLTATVAQPTTRAALRALVAGTRQSTADWKIVFAHEPLVSTGAFVQTPDQQTLDQRCAMHLREGKVDLVICAGGGALRLSAPKDGIPIVQSGGGGGPEMGVEPDIVPGTVFAWGGGGFTWFRFDGKKLEISFRAADGKVLYTHVLSK